MSDDSSMDPEELEVVAKLEAAHAVERRKRIVAKKKNQSRFRLLAILLLL